MTRKALVCVVLALFACSTAPAADPGINERFLAPDLDVAHYTEVFEGESREIYAEREAIANAVGLRPGMDVADIGAGTGLFIAPFANAVGPEGSVSAVDISPRFLDHLRARVASEGLAQVEVVTGSSDSPNLPADSFDVVFVCDTYHHFETPESMLAGLRRALRPGGRLVVIDFERIPGKTSPFLMSHVRASKSVFRAEIEAAGFSLLEEVPIPGLSQNYFLRFERD